MTMQKIDKVNMLKGILAGKIKKKDLKPKDFLIKIGYGTGPQFFINDKKINENDFNEALKADKHPEQGICSIEYGNKE